MKFNMSTFAKIYKRTFGTIGDVKEHILIDVPTTCDLFFPFGVPNDNHIKENGYEIFNKEILETEKWNDNQLVYGKLHFYYDEKHKYQRTFIIEILNAEEKYKKENDYE
jgi:hypothetical protein